MLGLGFGLDAVGCNILVLLVAPFATDVLRSSCIALKMVAAAVLPSVYSDSRRAAQSATRLRKCEERDKGRVRARVCAGEGEEEIGRGFE
jgi:hypothetical protein